MRWVPFLSILLIFMLITSSGLLDYIGIGDFNIKPGLMLIALVFFAINCEPSEAIACSFVIGLAADISSPSMAMGPHTVSFGIVGTAISFLQSQVIMKRLIYQSICIFVAGVLAGTMTEAMIYNKLSGQTLNSFEVIVMTNLYSALAGPIVWIFLRSMLDFVIVDPPSYAKRLAR